MINCKETATQISMKLRSAFAALLTILVIASVASVSLGFNYSRNITIIDNGNEESITTSKVYLDEIIAENKIALNKGDIISAPLHTRVAHGDVFTITRAKKINLVADGKTMPIFSCSATVKEALADNGIKLGQYDEISPVLETVVSNEMNVEIHRVDVKTVTLEEKIERTVRKIPSADHKSSYREVIKEGYDGLAKNEYKIITRDGEEISRELLASEVLVQPEDEIVKIGTYNTKVLASTRDELSGCKVITVNATAYDPDPASCGGSGITATGRPARFGLVAVDPRVIPLGSKLYIESTDDGKSWSYGYAIAADIGGAIKGNRIDLCYNTRSECLKFGRRNAKVYVLD